MPLVLSGNVGSATAATGFNVANSLRFNSGSTDFLNRTPSSASNKDLWSISAWVKRSTRGGYDTIYGVYTDSSNQENFGFLNSDKFQWQLYQSGGVVGQLTTTRLFRDPTAWMHILGVYDSANGTAGNRMRLYINGVEETEFATDTNPSDGQDSLWNSDTLHMFGSGGNGMSGGDLFDGHMAEIVALDGIAASPTSFGEFDDSGIWKPIKVSGLTFGTNGFYLQFEGSGTSANSSGMGADTSGNTHHFSVNNLTAVDQSIDTCTNNFCTLNSLVPTGGGFSPNSSTFSEGNLAFATNNSSNNWGYALGTFGVASGKWYWEVKVTTLGSGEMIGIAGNNSPGTNQHPGKDGNSYAYNYNQVIYGPDEGEASYGDAYGADDIIGVAMDLDNNKLYFSKNGTFQNSGDPTSGATGTGAKAITAAASTDKGFYFPAYAVANNNADGAASFNFGSPPYAISSGNTDGDGFGNFEYAVPSGYFALCTKNLAEYG